jgi:hypothetical protein
MRCSIAGLAMVLALSTATKADTLKFEFEGVIDQNTHVQTDGSIIDLSWFAEIGDTYQGFVIYDSTVPYVENTNAPEWSYFLDGEPNLFSATINGQTFAISNFSAANQIRYAPPVIDLWQSQFESRESPADDLLRAFNLVLRDYDKQTVLDFDNIEYGTRTTGLDDWEWAEFSFMVEPLGLGVSGPLTRFESAPIPEPSTFVVFSGLILSGAFIGWCRRRRKKA